MDSINLARTKRYIIANGFPSFEKVGFWDDSSPTEIGIIELELWHNRLYPTSDIDSLIELAVLNGDFRPDDWGAILMTREKPDSCIYCMKIWRVPEQFSEKREAEINKKRNAIYLTDMTQYRMMWHYTQENAMRMTTNYNEASYPVNESSKEQFVLLNDFFGAIKISN